VDRLGSRTDLKEGTLVSFDVDSLFTNVPLRESLSYIASLLDGDDTIGERSVFKTEELIQMIEFVLTKCYFRFEGSFYIMTDGVAMGSSLSGTVANIFMFKFEQLALGSVPSHMVVPDIWFRYVDDVLARFKGSCGDAEEFLTFLNGLRPSINFTLEFEQDGFLPFLDVGIRKTETGVIFEVFRKPTHTNLYINRRSCHPPGVFKGLVSTLKKRALSVCSEGRLKEELSFLRETLLSNGYGDKEIRSLEATSSKREISPVKPKGFIPFIPGLSQRIVAILRKVGVQIGLRPAPSLRSAFSARGDPEKRLGVIYRVSCEDCQWSYVGETGRTWAVRKKEHERAVKKANIDSSEVARHVWEEGHRLDWAASGPLDQEGRWKRRQIKEAYWSQKFSSSNKVFYTLSDAWMRV
jgi:hypothetical protein